MQTDNQKKGILYAGPMGLWFILFFALPMVIIILYSFLTRGMYGGVEWKFTLDAFRQVFNPNFVEILIRTFLITVGCTALCILLALPCAYAMARSRHQILFLLLIMIPFWTNSLIRIYAWINLLSADGIINQFLISLHIIKTPLKLIYNQNAVIVVLTYMFLPYSILPLFSTMDRFNFSLLEAARDLGATKLQSLTKIMLPSIRGGIVTSIIFTAIPVFGAYTVPLLIGGIDSYMVGNIIVDQVTKTRNWPLASAFSMLLTVPITIAIIIGLGGKKNEKK